MAEFQKVMKQARRMCNELDDCDQCGLMTDNGCCMDMTVCQMADGEIERIVMDWAEKHPEPRYPSWEEWQKANFPNANVKVSPCAFSDSKSFRCMNHGCDACRDFPIPADIAEKLGIKPIGGDADA